MKKRKWIEWIKEKQKQWRRYRDRENITEKGEEELRERLILKIPERKKK